MFRKSTKIYHHDVKVCWACPSFILIVFLCLVCFASPTHAGIATTGDVDPAEPATWTSGTTGYIGKTTSGTMDITTDSDVLSWRGYIGNSSDSTGEVTVDGAGSTWTNDDDVFVGYYGNGTLNITNGGGVNNHYSKIGYYSSSTSTVTVDGAGSTWWNMYPITVGGYGNGTLNIKNGGVVNSNYKVDSDSIGYFSGSMGAVTVDGFNSKWRSNSGQFNVGQWGSGELNITNGGAVSIGRGHIGNTPSSTGTVTIDGAGSTWTNRDYLHVGYQGDGTLNIQNGGAVSVAGTLTIDFDADGGSFVCMGGGGMLALNGDADSSLIDFLNLIGGTDAVYYWDESALNWANITSATLGDDYTLSYLTTGDLTGYTMLTMNTASIPVFLEGDATHDSVVSAGDYASIQANFGNTGPEGIQGDANLDGVVSAGDYACVQANFGNVAATTEVTPEPATLSLLVTGGLGLLHRRRNA